jgi:3-(3-hydroxy-phenyl)propionate hydroxylase
MTGIEPVLIVGAGPTGMTAALDLAHHGIPSILVDEDHELSGGSRAIAYHHSTLGIWEKLGAAEPMIKKGIAWSTRHTYFREKELYTQRFPAPRDGLLPRFLNLQQYYVEQFLLERIERIPAIELRWDQRVTGLQQDANGVTIEAETPAGKVQLHGRYALACDGARSTLRKLLGLDFPGTTFDDHFLIADIRADLGYAPEPRFYFDHPTNPGQTVLIHPQPDGIWRIDWQVGAGVDIDEERSPERMDARIRALIGDIEYEIAWLSDYRFHERLLERFRHGNIFFAGDAAHLVAPFGARGMNSAILDAENLAWKLALVLHGHAPQSLLDTYQNERWPAQHHNQQVTTATMRFMAPATRGQRLRRDLILRLSGPLPFMRPLVDSGRMSEPFAYTRSPILLPDRERGWSFAPPVGAKIIDQPCRLYNSSGIRETWLRTLLGGGFVLLYFALDERTARQAADALRRLSFAAPVRLLSILPESPRSPAGEVLVDTQGEFLDVYDGQPGTLYLIRPDGHLAARRRQCPADEWPGLVACACGVEFPG